MSEIHDLAAPYVLDALDPEESAAFEAHLQTCVACRAEVGELAEGAAELASAVGMTPPPRVKDAVMDAIDDSQPESNIVSIDSRRPILAWALTGAAAVLALVFFGLWTISSNQLDEANQIAAVYEAPDAVVFDIESESGPSRLIFSPSLATGVYNGGQLAELGTDEVYQLWLIGDEIAPAGTLEPGQIVLVDDVSPGQTFAMTIEHSPGVDAPTSDPLFGTEL